MISLKTSDKHIIKIEEKYASKSNLLRNIMEITEHSEPIDILIDRATMEKIYLFMIKDNHVLGVDYNPLEIYFSPENFEFFDYENTSEILDICNGANYLDYPFLLELCCKVIANELANNPRSDLAQIVRGPKSFSKDRMQQEYGWYDES